MSPKLLSHQKIIDSLGSIGKYKEAKRQRADMKKLRKSEVREFEKIREKKAETKINIVLK